MRPRLYLDEDLLPSIAPALRARGYDVIAAREVGATGIPDEEQLARASEDNRAIVTANHHDFRRIANEWIAAGVDHAGIVLSMRQYERDELRIAIETFEGLLNGIDAEHLRNATVSLDSFRKSDSQ